jgi:RNA polymerase sigma-70 factor, ECF subfamily
VQSNHATLTQSTGAPVDFRALFEAEFAYVARTLRYLGVRGHELEDVTHEVFLHVSRHLAEFDTTRPLRPWLFRFVYRIARDFRALARHHHEFAWEPPELCDSAPLADELLVKSQALDQALRALDALDADERAVFIAHDLEELTMPEVVEALTIPLNTAYSRLRRARSKFEVAARRLAAEERDR